MEIIEGNKLIAEFMGGKFYPSTPTIMEKGIISPAGNEVRCSDKLKYHSSWDWLKVVIDKIFEYALAYPEQVKQIIDMSIVVNIKVANTRVIAFIQWLNGQSK